MWAYPCICHPPIHPSIQKLLRPSYLPTKTGTHLAHTSLVWLRFLHLRLDVFERDVWGLKLCILKKKKLGEKTYFLKPPSERNFDFMVLIIFLQNHSRIKHKDAEIVPLSHAPQWGSLVRKTRRHPPPAPTLFFNFAFYTPTIYNLLKVRQRQPGSCLMHLLRLRGACMGNTSLAETIHFLIRVIPFSVGGRKPFPSATIPNMALPQKELPDLTDLT